MVDKKSKFEKEMEELNRMKQASSDKDWNKSGDTSMDKDIMAASKKSKK